MAAEVELRRVPDFAPEPEAPPEEPPPSYQRTAVVLGMALVLVLGGWVLSEVQRGRAVRELTAQIQALDEQLVERDRAIAAQTQRLEDVRDHVESLRLLLESPLSGGR